jgi:hypothetical protein
MAKTQTFSLPKQPPEPPLLRIEPFKGLNLSVTPTQIDDHQSPDLLNVSSDERGALNKRTGYERVFPTSLGTGQINGLYEFNGVTLLAWGTKLFTQTGNTQPVQIYSGLANQSVDFFVVNGKCYIKDGVDYLVYDGSTCTTVIPYIPTTSIADGLLATGATKNEDFNLLGSGFKESRSGDGTVTAFPLSVQNLDATIVTALVDNVAKVEGTGFAVDRTLGKVTFTTAPAKGTNNVIITAYKTQAGFPDRIKKCRFHTIFGGSNDTRVFVSGNNDMKGYVWRLGLDDPTYAPENGFYKYSDTVAGFSKQYDYLVVHMANGYRVINYVIDANGVASFPSKPINDQVGTLAEKSIQIIENNPVSLSKNGVYEVVQSNIRDERNVQHISENVDAKLLLEPNLDKAISIDYGNKYWLAVNGNVYVYDYRIREWFIYDNIKANCFLERNGDLYFGSSTVGLLYRFKQTTEAFPFSDDGQPITAYWLSKVMSFGADERRKLVEKVYFSLNPAIHTSADLYYVSDKKSRKFVKETRKDLFHYGYVDYSKFSYGSRVFPQEAMNKIKAKKIVYFQLEIRNEQMDEPFGLLSLGLKFQYQALVK